MVGPRSDDRPERVSPVPSREPQLRLVSPMPPQPRGTAAVPGGKPTLYLETSSRTAWRDGVPVHLSRREYDLLSYLCRHPRRVFGRAQLLRSVWEYEMVGGERTVDVHVRRLRAKLGECADGIVTVRGVGYRFDDQAVVAIVADPE
ncbi:MAG: winged helix-turn-helix transcriptional regulator [Dactylosporangium sp.]|nr:winged helix-turn-helix domain-containing protein [Dactylosporangium sp.]NNJ62099.1 winged helix-turn-helix transcriptional regulator [Dactylosporangium sp.]